MRLRSFLIFLVLCLSALGTVPALLAFRSHLPFSNHFHGLQIDRPAPDFALLDAEGRERSLHNTGRYRYIFFGYSRCGTLCPSVWGKFIQLQQQLKDDVDRPTMLFISLDPEHDSPQRLHQKFKTLGTDFVALTGSKEEIAGIARAYHIQTLENTDRSIHHSGTLYLIDPQNRIALLYVDPPDIQTLLADLTRLKE